MNIISFSTGILSALTVERVIARYGRDNCKIVFMDTTIEDTDNYRFLADCQKRWGEITILRDGRTPYQVAEQKHIIPNQKIAPCTFELKIKPFMNWLEKNHPPGSATIHIGYDIFEAHRCEATTKNYNAAGYDVDFPMLWKPLENRPYAQVLIDDYNLQPPRTYKMGFSHANCLGDDNKPDKEAGCVKMGIGDWIKMLINKPTFYNNSEIWEQEMRQHPTRKDYAILRDQSGGTVKPLTLKELRERIESQAELQPSMFDNVTVACVSCGVGDFLANRPYAAELEAK